MLTVMAWLISRRWPRSCRPSTTCWAREQSSQLTQQRRELKIFLTGWYMFLETEFYYIYFLKSLLCSYFQEVRTRIKFALVIVFLCYVYVEKFVYSNEKTNTSVWFHSFFSPFVSIFFFTSLWWVADWKVKNPFKQLLFFLFMWKGSFWIVLQI